MESVYDHLLTDEDSNHLPWFTYPAIQYLKQLDLSNSTIFEWGSGNSSIFFSRRCKQITSIENDHEWFLFATENKNENQEILYLTDENAYTTSMDKNYDIAIVDGSHRNQCVEKSIEFLSQCKLIILDNSNWHVKSCNFLREKTNFIQIDFHGMGPINDYAWTTSLFFNRDFDIKPLDNSSPKKPIGGNLVFDC